MEALVTIALIEMVLIKAITETERSRRYELLIKWSTGAISMDEIHTLKKQSWFTSQFKKVTTSPAKKVD